MIIGDIETDGLDYTKIHCAVFYNLETGIWTKFADDDYGFSPYLRINMIPKFLDNAGRLCMHNGIGFDLKVLKNILNYEYKGYYIDTLLMSKILYPDIEKPKGCKGQHSIEAWGIRFGIEKPVQENWDEFSNEMLFRCEEDVRIQAQLYRKCIEEINNYKNHDRRLTRWDDIFELEMDFWRGMEKQMENGWLLDENKLQSHVKILTEQLNEIDEQLSDILPPVVKNKGECQLFKINGKLTNAAEKWIFSNYPKIFSIHFKGDFSRVEYKKLNVRSSKQLKNFLLKEGWIPTSYNVKKDNYNKPIKNHEGKNIITSPKTPSTEEEWDKVAKEINSPSIKLLINRNKIEHRLGLLQGLYDKRRPDGRVVARINSCGTPTSRARHFDIVNIPKAKQHVFFGKECREIFIVPENKVMVGADASALEARCEAHYLYKIDPEAAKFIIEGDIHSLNSEIWDVERDVAKSGRYALGYGCSPDKLALTLGKRPEMGKYLYEIFWKANPALEELIKRIQEQYKSKGYLVSIDGRPLIIRYFHACLNTLLQSAGAIIMKRAWKFFNHWRVTSGNKDYILDIGNYHDESQMEVSELNDIYAYEVGYKFVECIRLAGEYYNFNVPLTGEYKVGYDWSETH